MVADEITSTIFILRFYKRQTKGLKPIRVSIGEVSDFILKKLLFQTEETKVSL